MEVVLATGTLVLSTAAEADEPSYQTFADTLGTISTASSVLRAARNVVEREARALKQLVAMKLDINPCDYYAGWKASGWKQGYNPYPAHVAALDFGPMYTPLAKADRLLTAAGGATAKNAPQFRDAALMIKRFG